jgi:hypothetical protein
MTYATSDFERNVPLVYMETSIPAGMSIADYRISRSRKPSLRDRVRSHLRSSQNENR